MHGSNKLTHPQHSAAKLQENLYISTVPLHSQERRVCDDEVNLPGCHTGLVQQLLNGGEACGTKLKPGGLNTQLAHVTGLDGWADGSPLPKPCPVRDLLLW